MRNTRKGQELHKLHRSLVDLIAVINRPQHDEALIKEAGIALDRALFPLLVGIERFGPIGVVDLAERAGRDHTTVSRQVAKLERLRLVKRRASQGDQRVREATITNKGRVISDALDAARKRLARSILAQWSEHDLQDLVRLVSRFAGDALAWSSNQRAHDLQATRQNRILISGIPFWAKMAEPAPAPGVRKGAVPRQRRK